MKNELSSVEKEEGHCIAVEIFPHFYFPFSLSYPSLHTVSSVMLFRSNLQVVIEKQIVSIEAI